MNDTADSPVKATTTSMRILEALLARGEAPLTELANEVALSKSSVHNHLATLEQLGLVVKTEMSYRVSLRFLEIGTAVRSAVPFYESGRREVERLSNAAGLTAGLAVFERASAVCLHSTHGQEPGTVPLVAGETVPLHGSAPGKAILAELPAERLDATIDAVDLEPLTPNTVTTGSDLRDQLERVRTRGVAPDHEEWRPDMRGLAAGFSTADGATVGSIFVLSESESMSGKTFQQDVPGLLVSAANQIRQEL